MNRGTPEPCRPSMVDKYCHHPYFDTTTTTTTTTSNNTFTTIKSIMISILKVSTLALCASVSVAQSVLESCDVEEGVTVTSSTFPKAEGCYLYNGEINGFDSFIEENQNGSILPGTRDIPETDQFINRWVFFAGTPGKTGSTFCYTDRFPLGNPGSDLTDVTDCDDGTQNASVQFTCGCGDHTEESPTPAPVVVDPSTGFPTPSPVDDTVFLSNDFDESRGSLTTESPTGSPTGSPSGSPVGDVADSSGDDDVEAVVREASSGSVASIGIVGYICTTFAGLVGAFVAL